VGEARAGSLVAQLRRWLAEGRYAAGSRLAEETVAQDLGVSRTPVRLAFRTLAQEGLLESAGKRGYVVRTAENGEEAMRRLTEDKPDLILMDVVMPGQNGFQLTRAITRDPRFADVPVIMCTSKNQETDKVWGMRQGAKDYIVKPVNADELVSKIRAFD
jgi:twitching motility two-component system response regulator PilH